jgi:hypothetical protein
VFGASNCFDNSQAQQRDERLEYLQMILYIDHTIIEVGLVKKV